MSLIGKLEQVSLPAIFQRIEQYSKTGVLVITQEEQWVELYFRDGRLMCIGPVRANTTLGDRLVQAGVITAEALHAVILTIGEAQLSETRIALTLMDLGYTSGEDLRAWSTKEVTGVLSALLTWKIGKIYFEENRFPPADRLLVSLTMSELLSTRAQPPFTTIAAQQGQQAQSELNIVPPVHAVAPQNAHQPSVPIQPSVIMSASQLIVEASPVASTIGAREVLRPMPTIDLVGDVQSTSSSAPSYPQRVTRPLGPIHVDTTSIQPDMVLFPVDLSALREQNPQMPLTPEQWRLLTRADGRTTLKDACFELHMPADVVRQVAGELSVLGLVQVMVPPRSAERIAELSPVSQQLLISGLGNGYVQPGYAAVAPQPWAIAAPAIHGVHHVPHVTTSFEVQSQWGNGGNGTSFILGQGWVSGSQPLPPLPSGQGMYAQAGSGL